MIKRLIFTLLLLFGMSTISGHPSYGIAVDNDGNIYFADLFHNEMGSVWKLTPSGQLQLIFGNFHAHNLSLDEQGNLYTAHGENDHVMLRYQPGIIIDTLYATTDIREFFGGNGIYRDEKIYFQIDNKVWVIDKEGNKTQFSDHEFEWNQSLYADADGNIYGPDLGEGRGNGKVVRLSPDGSVKVIAEGLLTILERGYDRHQDVMLGMAQDSNGDLYIAETAGRRIINCTSDGGPQTFYVSEAPWFPTGIAFHNGSAFILEFKQEGGYGGPRITRMDKGGDKTVIFDFDTHTNPMVNDKDDEKKGGFPLWAAGLMMGGAMLTLISVFILVRARKRQTA